MKKIPVTIVTGFLGAGKTTLINNILSKHGTQEFALLMNEFGDINIDSALIKYKQDNIIELTNGCVCCSMNDQFEETMITLLETGYNFEHIIVETTGVADPNPLAGTIIHGKAKDMLELNATICVVDAFNFDNQLENDDLIYRQIAFSDIVIVNKVETKDKEELEKILDMIRKINNEAILLTTVKADVSGFDLLNSLASNNPVPDDLIILNNFDNNHNVESFSLEFDIDFDKSSFEYQISMILENYGSNIYRVKGILSFFKKDKKMIFHSVQNFGSLQEGDFWGRNDIRKSKLVFIGKHLNKKDIYNKLTECLATDDE